MVTAIEGNGQGRIGNIRRGVSEHYFAPWDDILYL
jgi:hypothetical protein